MALPRPIGLVPAEVTVPPEKEMVGVPLKPIPALVTLIPETVPLVKIAVATAPLPPPMVTVGATE